MDNGLVHTRGMVSNVRFTVLILVVVDNGLVLLISSILVQEMLCLNPCCSGQWSRTTFKTMINFSNFVLILVVVDNGLVPYEAFS